MPFNSKIRSERAAKQVRDKNGHFTSLKPKVRISGSANTLSGLIKTEKDHDPFNLLTIRVGDSITHIIQILDDIRKKQATTINMKFTIPLIVLPAVLLAAFTLGKWQSGCSDYFSSQVGTLQGVTITRKFPPENWFLNLLTWLPYMGDWLSKEKTLTQPVLIDQSNQALIINNEANIHLAPFDQGKIIIFGTYNSCSKTLTLDSAQNISNY